MVKGNRGLLRLVAIGNQSTDDIDQAVDWTAVPGMLNLGNVLQLVNDGFNERTLPQQQAVAQGHQTILHVAFEFGNQLHPNAL